MRGSLWSKRSMIRVIVALCLVLVSVAYVRVMRTDTAQTSAQPARMLPIYRVDRTDRRIAISFDAAWGAEKTSQIMDIVEQKGLRTTFFLVGFWVERYPDKVKEIAMRGHEIGNHSTNHPHMTQLTPVQMRQELNTTSDMIERLTQQRPTLFRPPFGDYSNAVIQTVRDEGYIPIQWDVDSLDWKSQGAKAMTAQVTSRVKPGSIVLFHNNSDDILEALPEILNQLTNAGYQIVPVSELLLQGETIIDATGCQKLAAR